MLVEEFGIDSVDTWRSHLASGREKWRRTQLKAAVRDAPEDAAETLRSLGYDVVAAEAPPDNTASLRQY